MPEAGNEMKRALELDSLSLPINTNLGFVHYFARRYDEAIEQFRKALDMDGNFAEAHRGLGEALIQKGMLAEAASALRQAWTLSGGSTESLAQLGHAYAVAGMTTEVQQVLEDLTAQGQHKYVPAHDVAAIYTGLGEKEQAFQWLEKAYEQHSYLLVWLKVDPKMDSLRADPRFTDLLRRLNLPM
jgi:adenylate cyclase